MFWTNWNDHKPSIQTSSFDGYRVQSIITKNIRTPNGLAIDHKAQRLYWTDARLDKIERCEFDGSNCVVSSNCVYSITLVVREIKISPYSGCIRIKCFVLEDPLQADALGIVCHCFAGEHELNLLAC